MATNFQYCNDLIQEFEAVCKKPKLRKNAKYYCGVDLGTACVVLSVVDEQMRPVAGRYLYADVVRDGMVVDYLGAIHLLRDMKEQVEQELQSELLYAAAAIPPGTDMLDGGAVKNVVQAAGFELTNLLDESTAANAVIGISNGAIVDIGGGTTGISIFKNGEVIYTADEPTGGTHFSLVLAGALKVSFEEAEKKKRDNANHKEIFPILRPVTEKVASIIQNHITGHNVSEICLVGGTSCLTGIEEVIEKRLEIPTFKPRNPMFVTPLGIALNCRQIPM